MTTAFEGVRGEVRDGLYDLAALLREDSPSYHRITNALIHLWYLAGLAEREGLPGELLERPLEKLSIELQSASALDRRAHARDLARLGDDLAAAEPGW